MIKYLKANSEDFESIIRLLVTNDLPNSDVKDSPIKFIVAKSEGDIVGCIGLEIYETDGLLRSFAVEPSYRNNGIGAELYKNLLAFALENKVNTLHLLTTTAKDYFLKKGFKVTDKNQAPIGIKKSSEFDGLCPVSCIYMVKNIK